MEAVRGNWTVYVDDQKVSEAITAYPGAVLCNALNSDGQPYLTEDGEVATETKTGYVRVYADDILVLEG